MMRLGASAMLLLLTGCTYSDAGCQSYGEARTTMPVLTQSAEGSWIAETDSRMTATCRG